MASSENLFAFEQIRVDNRVDATLIFEGVNKVLEEYADTRDHVFDFLGAVSVKVQEELMEAVTRNGLSGQ